MAGFAVGGLVAISGFQREPFSVGEFGFQLALQAENYVPFCAPVVGQISGRVFDHADADLAEILRSPERAASLPRMLGWDYLGPVGGGECKAGHLHTEEYS